jgi:hypothetical protein
MSSHGLSLPPVMRLTGSSLVESFRLRFVVWKDECTLVPQVWNDQELRDEHDEHAVHYGIFDDDVLVASSRCCIHEHVADLPDSQVYEQLNVASPIATMNRLVVRR